MTVNTAQGARFYIGTTQSIDETSSVTALADFEADSYVEVGEVEDLGEFGDQSDEVNFTALGDGRVRKIKGPRNAGSMNLVVGSDSNDEGQDAMIAAEAQTLDYNFKVVANDAVTIGGNASVRYFRGKVMSKRENFGNASNVVRRTFAVGVNSAVYEVAAT